MKIHLVGGFLGSGKTTAILAAARYYLISGKKVAIITNDQGKYLVDTNFFLMEDFPAIEVSGGCYCCNYYDFAEKIDYIIDTISPEIIFAESVGSCTDLVATVVKPLLDLQAQKESDTTFSVLCDSRVLLKYLSGEELPFQERILYIFEKQIEESGVLVLNKMDLLNNDQTRRLQVLVHEKYADKIVVNQNSLKTEGIGEWLRVLNSDLYLPKSKLDLDYQIYGNGEHQLAWYDGILRIQYQNNNKGFDDWLQESIKLFMGILKGQEIAIGHLKFLVNDHHHHKKLSITNLSDTLEFEKLKIKWKSPIELTINARLECDADQLKIWLQDVFFKRNTNNGINIEVVSEQSFHPEFPKPTYRY
jgi:G3E family GTPase